MFIAWHGKERIAAPDVRINMVEGDDFVQLNGYGHIVAVKRAGELVGWSPTFEYLRIPNEQRPALRSHFVNRTEGR